MGLGSILVCRLLSNMVYFYIPRTKFSTRVYTFFIFVIMVKNVKKAKHSILVWVANKEFPTWYQKIISSQLPKHVVFLIVTFLSNRIPLCLVLLNSLLGWQARDASLHVWIGCVSKYSQPTVICRRGSSVLLELCQTWSRHTVYWFRASVSIAQNPLITN